MTAEGYQALDAELKRLKTVERPAVIAAIAEARQHGDLSENAEYHAAKERQSFIEGRLADLEDKIARAQVIDVSKLSGKQVKFGATVNLVDEDTGVKSKYKIVGEDESDVQAGKVSITSPIARALIGKEEGDVVEVMAPGGAKSRRLHLGPGPASGLAQVGIKHFRPPHLGEVVTDVGPVSGITVIARRAPGPLHIPFARSTTGTDINGLRIGDTSTQDQPCRNHQKFPNQAFLHLESPHVK